MFSGATLHVRWVPSELNPADEASRDRSPAGLQANALAGAPARADGRRVVPTFLGEKIDDAFRKALSEYINADGGA
eukprot:10324004-Heterocapsa_arctica.AAC.1